MNNDTDTTQDPPEDASADDGSEVSEYAPDAIIYVPGLALGLSTSRTFAGVTQKIAKACDRQSSDRPARFAAKMKQADLGDEYGEMTRSVISATVGDITTPRVDIYRFQWSQELTSRWESQGNRAKLLRGGVGFWYGVRLFLFTFGTALRSFSVRRAVQALIALVALAVISIYILGLVVAAVTVIIERLDETQDWGDDIQKVVIVATAALTFLLPSLRNRIPTIGATLLAASDYVRMPGQHQRIAGELTGMVEAIAETGRHERIHVVAYSMGGIIAVDAIFPAAGKPVRALESVTSLTTIAAPFEAVRATRPTYFDGRSASTASTTWTTYWAEADVLSSDVPRPKKQKTLNLGPRRPEPILYKLPTDLRLPSMLIMAGLTAHGLYWGPDNEADLNVFDEVVVQLGLHDPKVATDA